MRLIEITISITTRYLEHERNEFISMVNSVIDNNIMLTDDEFNSLLEISSTIMSKYNINDSGFSDIVDSFSTLVRYHRNKRKA